MHESDSLISRNGAGPTFSHITEYFKQIRTGASIYIII